MPSTEVSVCEAFQFFNRTESAELIKNLVLEGRIPVLESMLVYKTDVYQSYLWATPEGLFHFGFDAFDSTGVEWSIERIHVQRWDISEAGVELKGSIATAKYEIPITLDLFGQDATYVSVGTMLERLSAPLDFVGTIRISQTKTGISDIIFSKTEISVKSFGLDSAFFVSPSSARKALQVRNPDPSRGIYVNNKQFNIDGSEDHDYTPSLFSSDTTKAETIVRQGIIGLMQQCATGATRSGLLDARGTPSFFNAVSRLGRTAHPGMFTAQNSENVDVVPFPDGSEILVFAALGQNGSVKFASSSTTEVGWKRTYLQDKETIFYNLAGVYYPPTDPNAPSTTTSGTLNYLLYGLIYKAPNNSSNKGYVVGTYLDSDWQPTKVKLPVGSDTSTVIFPINPSRFKGVFNSTPSETKHAALFYAWDLNTYSFQFCSNGSYTSQLVSATISASKENQLHPATTADLPSLNAFKEYYIYSNGPGKKKKAKPDVDVLLWFINSQYATNNGKSTNPVFFYLHGFSEEVLYGSTNSKTSNQKMYPRVEFEVPADSFCTELGHELNLMNIFCSHGYIFIVGMRYLWVYELRYTFPGTNKSTLDVILPADAPYPPQLNEVLHLKNVQKVPLPPYLSKNANAATLENTISHIETVDITKDVTIAWVQSAGILWSTRIEFDPNSTSPSTSGTTSPTRPTVTIEPTIGYKGGVLSFGTFTEYDTQGDESLVTRVFAIDRYGLTMNTVELGTGDIAWEPVLTSDAHHAIGVDAFISKVRILNYLGNSIPYKHVRISADPPCLVWINGQAYNVSGNHPICVTSDANGQLLIELDTIGLSIPTVAFEFLDRYSTITFNDHLLGRLSLLFSADPADLLKLKNSNNEPLFSGKYITNKHGLSNIEIIKEFLDSCFNLVRNPYQFNSNYFGWTVESGYEMVKGFVTPTHNPASLYGVDTYLGEFIEGAKKQVTPKGKDVQPNVVSGFQFTREFGVTGAIFLEGTTEIVFDVRDGSGAWELIDWGLNTLLDVSLDDMIAYFHHAPNLAKIKAAQQKLTTYFNDGLNTFRNLLPSASTILEPLNTLAEMLDGGSLSSQSSDLSWSDILSRQYEAKKAGSSTQVLQDATEAAQDPLVTLWADVFRHHDEDADFSIALDDSDIDAIESAVNAFIHDTAATGTLVSLNAFAEDFAAQLLEMFNANRQVSDVSEIITYSVVSQFEQLARRLSPLLDAVQDQVFKALFEAFDAAVTAKISVPLVSELASPTQGGEPVLSPGTTLELTTLLVAAQVVALEELIEASTTTEVAPTAWPGQEKEAQANPITGNAVYGVGLGYVMSKAFELTVFVGRAPFEEGKGPRKKTNLGYLQSGSALACAVIAGGIDQLTPPVNPTKTQQIFRAGASIAAGFSVALSIFVFVYKRLKIKEYNKTTDQQKKEDLQSETNSILETIGSIIIFLALLRYFLQVAGGSIDPAQQDSLRLAQNTFEMFLKVLNGQGFALGGNARTGFHLKRLISVPMFVGTGIAHTAYVAEEGNVPYQAT